MKNSAASRKKDDTTETPDAAPTKSNDPTREEHPEREFDNHDTSDRTREIRHLIFAVHGIGHKNSGRSEAFGFLHDVNNFRRLLKNSYKTVISHSSEEPDANATVSGRVVCFC